jgi:hypothetical protein
MGTVVGPPTRVSAADRDDDELVTGETTRSKVAISPFNPKQHRLLVSTLVFTCRRLDSVWIRV